MRFPGLLCVLLALHAAVQAEEKREEPAAQEAKGERLKICNAIFSRMQRRISFEFKETPVSEALTFVQILMRVSSFSDGAGMSEKKISLKCSDVAMATAFSDVLTEAGLDWTIGVSPGGGKGGKEKLALYISSPERVKAMNGKYPGIAKAVAAFRERMKAEEKQRCLESRAKRPPSQ